MRCLVQRPVVTGLTLLAAAALAVSGCSKSSSNHPAAGCLSGHAAAGTAGSAPGGSANPG